MTCVLETQRVVSLQCPDIYRLAISVPMLILFFLSFFLSFFIFGLLAYGQMSYHGGFFKLRSNDGGF